MNKYILLLALFFISAKTYAQDVDIAEISDMDDYQSALEEARSADKMLWIALTRDEDGSFEKMEDEGIFESPQVVSALQPFYTMHIPVDSEMGSRWVQLFPADSLPSFYYLNEENEFLLRIAEGYQSAVQLSAVSKEVYANRNTYETLSDKYNSRSLSVSEWKTLLELHALNFDFQETMSLALGFLNGLDENQLLQAEVLPVLTAYGIDLRTKYPSWIIAHRSAIASRLDGFSFQQFFERTYSYNLDLAILNQDSIFLEKLITEVVRFSEDPATTPRTLAYETRLLFAEETKNFNVWKKASFEYIEELATDSLKAEALFEDGFAIADRYNSPNAQKAARSLAEEANKLNESFRYRMLESYMAYLLKDYDNAETLVRQAATLTDNPNNIRKAEGLLRMIVTEKE